MIAEFNSCINADRECALVRACVWCMCKCVCPEEEFALAA